MAKKDVVEMIKVDMSAINDLRLSALQYAELDGYTRCIKEIYGTELARLEHEIESCKKNLEQAEKSGADQKVLEYFLENRNNAEFERDVLIAQKEIVLALIPKYVFPVEYDQKVKVILAEEDDTARMQTIMSTFAVTTQKGADSFFQTLFLPPKATGTKKRAGIKKVDGQQEMSAKHSHFLQTLSKKQIEKNIILFICEKLARQDQYIFSYDIYLNMSWEQIIDQIETLYVTADMVGFEGTRKKAERIVLEVRKKAREEQEQES